jgi:hypothetical protein
METTAFVLGMLTITLVAMISVIVVGIVKIMKLQKQVKESNMYFETCIQNIHRTERENLDNIHRRMDESHSEVWRQFERTGRDVTMVEQTIMNQIDKNRQEMDRAFDHVHQALSHEIEHGKRYTDSRIDKLVDTYFDVMGSKKIMIKG